MLLITIKAKSMSRVRMWHLYFLQPFFGGGYWVPPSKGSFYFSEASRLTFGTGGEPGPLPGHPHTGSSTFYFLLSSHFCDPNP